jgi:hypothetical protein
MLTLTEKMLSTQSKSVTTVYINFYCITLVIHKKNGDSFLN